MQGLRHLLRYLQGKLGWDAFVVCVCACVCENLYEGCFWGVLMCMCMCACLWDASGVCVYVCECVHVRARKYKGCAALHLCCLQGLTHRGNACSVGAE